MTINSLKKQIAKNVSSIQNAIYGSVKIALYNVLE